MLSMTTRKRPIWTETPAMSDLVRCYVCYTLTKVSARSGVLRVHQDADGYRCPNRDPAPTRTPASMGRMPSAAETPSRTVSVPDDVYDAAAAKAAADGETVSDVVSRALAAYLAD
jgi:hypothetical protein